MAPSWTKTVNGLLVASLFSVALVGSEVLRIYLIVYEHVEAWRLRTVGWFIFFLLYVPNRVIVLLGSKPFLDYNSHDVGIGNEWTAMMLVVTASSLLYFGLFALIHFLRRWLLFRKRHDGGEVKHAG